MSSDDSLELNEYKNMPRDWQPIHGVGNFIDEQYAKNYMIDSFEKVNSVEQMQTKKFSKEKAHYLDICEHRALLFDEHLTNLCVSHIESSSIVYIMTIDDHKRAMKLLETMRNIEMMNEEEKETFKPIENRLCAVKNNNEWLRARIQMLSTDKQIAKIRYIDWGNIVHVRAKDLRRLSNEFYQESACCLACHLDGIDDIPFDNKLLNIYQQILIGKDHRNFNLNLYVTKISQMNHLARIVLYRKSLNLNDEIYKHLPITVRNFSNKKEHLIEQFTHEYPLIIGEYYRALLSSFSGTDQSFYILIDNLNYNEFIENVLNEITDDNQFPFIIRPLMMVCVKYDEKYSRAWIQSIQNDEYQVFYVDWGNEERVEKERIRFCPEKIRYIPWLANRVQFHNLQLTDEQFIEFWKTIENDYVQIFVTNQYDDHYSIQMKSDYLNRIQKLQQMKF